MNSRHQRKSNQVWRRRRCEACRAVFTTEETAAYALAWLVKDKDGVFRPFQRDKLLLSLYRACEHRPEILRDAQGLAETIIRKLPATFWPDSPGTLHPEEIAQVVLIALTRFDQAAATRYEALHNYSLPARLQIQR